MTDESLSALLDGECSPAELDRLLDALERDPGLKTRFSRMCLARDSRHGARWRKPDLGFSDRVMAALDAEAAGGKVVSLRPRPAFAWRPLTGLAAAAGVAALAVLALKPDLGPGTATVAQVPAVQAGAAQVADQRWNRLDAEYVRQLNGYLMTHNHSRAQQGMGSTLGYARYTAHHVEPRLTPAPAEPRR